MNIEMYQSIQPDIIAKLENNWRVNPDIAGGGYFHDLASHQLDYLDFLFGPIIEAHGITGNQAHLYLADDLVTASFWFSSGVLGSGVWCFTTSSVSEKDVIRIIGSKGEIWFNTFGAPMVINLKNETIGGETLLFTHSEHIQQFLIQKVVDELRGVGTSPSNGISGARTSRVMEQITG